LAIQTENGKVFLVEECSAMAIMIPPSGSENSTAGENAVFKKLGRELPENWVVLHSVWSESGNGGPDRESDIFILSPLGFFSLEVKGGNVSCRQGVWTIQSREVSYSKKISPWDQSRNAYFSVTKKLASCDDSLRNVLGGWGVIMPRVRFDFEIVGCDKNILLDNQNYDDDITKFIEYLSAYHDEKTNRRFRKPTQSDIAKARKFLRPDFALVRPLVNQLDEFDAELIALTEQQVNVSRRLSRNPRTVVQGPAGTGKTIVAMDRARQAVAVGKRVLFLCYNRNLAEHVRKALSDINSRSGEGDIETTTLHSYARRFVEKNVKEDDIEHWEELVREATRAAYLKPGFVPWDLLIVDEMQDLLKPECLDFMDALLNSGFEDGQWHFFMDDSQNIFSGVGENKARERIEKCRPAIDFLDQNCRNTKSISIMVEEYSGIVPGKSNDVSGKYRKADLYKDDSDFCEKLGKVCDSLLIEDNLRSEDVVILSPRALENSILARVQKNLKYQIRKFDPHNSDKIGKINFSTIHAFKGLDSKVVILIDIDSLDEIENQRLLYVGMTRARTLLIPFLHQNLEERFRHLQEKIIERRAEQGVRK
jgi:ATP:corrinoid adenosyltransferase